MPRLFSVGNAIVDLLVAVPRLPASGDDVTASDSGTSAGGGGFNALVAARRQGVDCVYAGAHGTGPFGDLVRAALAAEGIAAAHGPIVGRDTGWDLAITEAGGERTFVTTVGAEADLDRVALDGVDVSTGDLVHVSGYGLAREPSGAAIAGWVAALPAGVVVLYDPGPLGAGSAHGDPVLARADWWSGNKREAAGPLGTNGVVVRLGSGGCRIREAGGEWVEVPGFVVDAHDTNGAGDAHVGVFLAGLAHGIRPHEAARRANAAAAIAVTRTGPATAPTAVELDAFLARG